MDGTRKYHPEWGNSITKTHTLYALTDKWILVLSLGIPKKQFTDHVNLKKNKDQTVDALVLLRRENKILTGGNTGTKSEAGTEKKVIQRWPHLGIHPIWSYQIQSLLLMPRSTWWQEPDMDVSWEAVLLTDVNEDAPTSTYPLPTQHYTGEMSLHSTKSFSSYWCLTMPSSATYAGGAICTLRLVV